MHSIRCSALASVILAAALATPAFGTPFVFDSGNPDGLIGMASRPASTGLLEIESADDFTTTATTSISGASFFGLLPSSATIADVASITIEIYRVFPEDSDVGRTSGPPTFSTNEVPTRVNSPSDVAFDDRMSASGELTFACNLLSTSFAVANSVVDGIHPKPNQTTGGDGPVTGQEVQCTVAFSTPFLLAADHYFFVPQVELASGTFLWLSAPRPIVPPGTPFSPDLQTWIRDENLAPDWLRVGTDIIGGAPTFNAAFSLVGETVPEPGTLVLLLAASWGVAFTRRRRGGASRAA